MKTIQIVKKDDLFQEYQSIALTTQKSSIEFTTRGLDSDQTVSAIKATEKMLNMI